MKMQSRSSTLMRSFLLVALALFAMAQAKKPDGDFSPTKCPNPMTVKEATDADKTSAKRIQKGLIPAQKKNQYYFAGNGRVWTEVFKVSKGQCLGCNDPELFRPLGEGGVQFCELDSVMASVAANYWKGKCDASRVSSTLKRFSTSGFHNQAASFVAQYKSTCGSKSKNIWVSGDSSDSYSGDNFYKVMMQPGMIEWSYGV